MQKETEYRERDVKQIWIWRRRWSLCWWWTQRKIRTAVNTINTQEGNEEEQNETHWAVCANPIYVLSVLDLRDILSVFGIISGSLNAIWIEMCTVHIALCVRLCVIFRKRPKFHLMLYCQFIHVFYSHHILFTSIAFTLSLEANGNIIIDQHLAYSTINIQ